ncbi:MAG TPA: HNH endonuclease signature motif containing protein, partial [Pseudonocardia sp.]|nr:HNH endonuclease signature motif containing protein [Pseudonocardia sp.]
DFGGTVSPESLRMLCCDAAVVRPSRLRSAGLVVRGPPIREWENGGPTGLDNVVMLCGVHHRQIHATDWTVRIRDGLPEFIPPPWIDPGQRPRRRALPHLVGASASA